MLTNIDLTNLLQIVLITGAAALLTKVTVTHLRSRRALRYRRPSARPGTYPSVSVIRPIKGLDVGARDNIRAALDNGYPGEVETLFVFDDADEPALPIVQKAIADHERDARDGSARTLLSGAPPPGRTGKLNAMIRGLAEARGEVVVFADSDIRPDRQALTRLVETLVTTPGAGSAFAPVVVTEPPRTAGDLGYALLLNGLYGPSFFRVAEQNEGRIPFIMGQFMAFKREAIAAIGGLESADGQLVDDMYLGARVAAAGYDNVVAFHPVPVIQHGMSFSEFLRTYVRWIAFSRSGLPGRTFKLTSWLRGVVFWTGLVGMLGAAAAGLWLAAAAMLAVPLAVGASIHALARRFGGAPVPARIGWTGPGVFLLAPGVYYRVLTRSHVNWRGRDYALDATARLETRRPEGGRPSVYAPQRGSH